MFFFRAGQNWGNRAYFPKADRTLAAEAVLASFLTQFYDDKPCPRLILLSHRPEECDLLAAALTLKSGHKVEVAVPQRGEKKELVDHATANAREALGRKLAESASQQRLLAALAATFGLDGPPHRIEVYDNSHIQGANAVGAMIVAGPEGFRKSQYRKFNIRSAALAPGDDYGMIREVFSRRFKRLLAEAPRVAVASAKSEPSVTSPLEGEAGALERAGRGVGGAVAVPGEQEKKIPPTPTLPLKGGGSLGVRPSEATTEEADRRDEPGADRDSERVADGGDDNHAPQSPWPDLVLIDGGAGQLAAARAVLAELGIADVPLVAIAKGPDRDAGRETFFTPEREPFRLPPRDPVLYFVERLRDEAHHFAVGSHRQRRKRNIREAGLQEIPGVGPARKRALLHHFGTLKAIERASVSDLAQVAGVSSETARRIYDFFHEQPR
jgi:excinuclease ABC subunit C